MKVARFSIHKPPTRISYDSEVDALYIQLTDGEQQYRVVRISDNQKRAKFELAIEALESSGYVKAQGDKREIFSLTTEGYEACKPHQAQPFGTLGAGIGCDKKSR